MNNMENDKITFNIKVKKNDFETPTEIREKVLQLVVDTLIDKVCDNKWKNFISIKNDKPYQCIIKDTLTLSPYEENKDNIRIRTCEMKKAFEIIQDAGYYIYCRKDCSLNGYTYYYITKKPYFENNKCHRIIFNDYID